MAQSAYPHHFNTTFQTKTWPGSCSYVCFHQSTQSREPELPFRGGTD